MSTLLQVSAISKRFPRAESAALDGVGFEVEPGEFIALVGASGSGKTSLLRILAGLETPDQGEVRLDGEVLTRTNRLLVPPEKRHMGFVFQNHALFPHLDVRQNVAFGLGRGAQANAVVEELLGLVGMSDFSDRYPHELSGGERQRAALARALAPNPRLLLMDEPFSSLDESLRETLRDETRALVRQRETTTILVTHNTADALAVADRIIVLKSGQVQQTGTPAEIYAAPANRYIAESFGPCNFIDRANLDDAAGIQGIEPESVAANEVWLRPEAVRVMQGQPGQAIARGKVTDRQFLGDGQMISVACKSAGGTDFAVRARHRGECAVAVGEMVSLAVASSETSTQGALPGATN